MPNINTAYQWAITACNNPNVGYSQAYRNEQTVNGITYYDCASFVWYALLRGGFDVVSAFKQAMGWDYTGNAITVSGEPSWLSALGFVEQRITGQWVEGDIVLNDDHTEIVYRGGNGRGITMGAHSDSYDLPNQVSIHTFESDSSDFSRIFRYGARPTLNINVVSAICGNWFGESNINPQRWESGKEATFDTEWYYDDTIGGGVGGYGLGQWTNTGESHGRLWDLHTWVTQNGYQDGDPYGQVAYMFVEQNWNPYTYDQSFASFDDFINSTSSDLRMLTRAFTGSWERIPPDPVLDTRYGYALKCFNYIMQHLNDNPSDYTWVVGNRYLTESETLNNAMCLYFALQGHMPPSPTPTGRKKMPIWMMIRYF